MKLFHTFVCIAFALNAFSQSFTNTSVPTISFQESSYFVEEGQSVEVCLDLKNFPSTYPGTFNLLKQNEEANFLDIPITNEELKNGKKCFTLNTSSPNGITNQFNTQQLAFQFNIPGDSTIISSPIEETTIYLKDDKPLINDPSVPLFIFKGVDDEVNESFSFSIVSTQFIENGSNFLITNANYLNGEWIPMFGELFEYIEIEWDGKYLIQPGTVLCFTLKDGVSLEKGFNKWDITINGSL